MRRACQAQALPTSRLFKLPSRPSESSFSTAMRRVCGGIPRPGSGSGEVRVPVRVSLMTFKAAECRRNAEKCFEQTKKTRDPTTKARFFELTLKWLALARQIEREESAEANPPSTADSRPKRRSLG